MKRGRLNDGCVKCGCDELWFDRTMEPPCDSMHYVCSSCGTTQPCSDDRCLYQRERRIGVEDENMDVRLRMKETTFGPDGFKITVRLDAGEDTDKVTILADRTAMSFEIGEARNLCVVLSEMLWEFDAKEDDHA